MTLFYITISYVIGIIWGLYVKITIVPLFILGIIVYKFLPHKIKRYIKVCIPINIIIICMISSLISNTIIMYKENTFINLYKNINQEDEIEVLAKIAGEAKEKEYYYTYDIEVQELNSKIKSVKGTHLLLKVKKEDKIYQYGDIILIKGKWQEPQGKRNYGGFDYKHYLKTQNIYGIIETKQEQIKIIKHTDSIIKQINKLAKKIKENIHKILPEEEASTLIGIVIGDTQNLNEDIKQNFRDSSLSHMLAVSGSHIAYVIISIMLVLKLIKFPKRGSYYILIIGLIFFSLLTGATAPVLRACLMAGYIQISALLYKKPDFLTNLSFSILLLIIVNPYNVYNIGLQLSFAGTVGIVLGTKYFKLPQRKHKISNKIQEMLWITLSANSLIIPITAYHFHTTSFTFLISNLLASIIIEIITILGFLITILSFISIEIAKIVVIPESFLIKIFLNIANFVANMPFSKIWIVRPKIIQIISYYLIITIIIFKQFTKSKKILKKYQKYILNHSKKIIITLIIIIIIPIIKIPNNNLYIHFIDVGQGDSTLIKTQNNKTFLIDGGGSKDTKSFDVGEQTLMPYLLDMGFRKINYMIISHFDADHVRWIINNFRKFNSRRSVDFKTRKKLRKLRKIFANSKAKKYKNKNFKSR